MSESLSDSLKAHTPKSRWRARLALAFDHDGTRTRIVQRAHEGPLYVQRAFYPEGDPACHVYVLHPPGGVVGGDELKIDIALHPRAHALITTPAAAKFYRSDGATAIQRQALTLGEYTICEWLPQESIIYSGAHVHTTTHVQLAHAARFSGWEILCLGRRAAGESFVTGAVQQRFELWRDAQLLFTERSRFDGGAEALDASWGLGGKSVTATLISTGHDATILPLLRLLAPIDRAAHGVTLLDDVLVCRYLGDDAGAARNYFTQALACIRGARGQPFVPPRIWAT